MEPEFGNVEANLKKMDAFIDQAAQQHADLIVFPELASSGEPTCGLNAYLPEDHHTIMRIAEQVPDGPTTQHFIKKAAECHMYICWSMFEKDPVDYTMTYNAGVLVGPEGFVGRYRKTHQPGTEEMMAWPGRELPVFDTTLGKVGIMICYEKAFPEVARTLALKGAKIILNPTDWPIKGEPREDDPWLMDANVFDFARALENGIVLVPSYATGDHMMGHSRIVGPNAGQVFATTGFDEGMAVADVDVEQVITDAKIDVLCGCNIVKDRKPALYGELVKPNPYNPWSGDMGQFSE